MRFLLLLITLFLFSCGKSDCKQEIPEICAFIDLVCPNKGAEVCGCDGTTYQCSGLAECIYGITEHKEGKCSKNSRVVSF